VCENPFVPESDQVALALGLFALESKPRRIIVMIQSTNAMGLKSLLTVSEGDHDLPGVFGWRSQLAVGCIHIGHGSLLFPAHGKLDPRDVVQQEQTNEFTRSS